MTGRARRPSCASSASGARPSAGTSAAIGPTAARAAPRSRVSCQCAPSALRAAPGASTSSSRRSRDHASLANPIWSSARATSGPSPSSSRKRVLAAIASRRRRSGTSMRAPPRLWLAQPDATCRADGSSAGSMARSAPSSSTARRSVAVWASGNRSTPRASPSRHVTDAARTGSASPDRTTWAASRASAAVESANRPGERARCRTGAPSTRSTVPARATELTCPESWACTANASATGTLLSFWISTTRRSSPRGPRAP